MLRGQQAIYNSIFPSSVIINPENKGKRNILSDKRDEALVARYYYYAELKRNRFDDCLMALENEFFLSAGYIGELVTKNVPVLKKLIDEKPTAKQLRKKYPFYNWN